MNTRLCRASVAAALAAGMLAGSSTAAAQRPLAARAARLAQPSGGPLAPAARAPSPLPLTTPGGIEAGEEAGGPSSAPASDPLVSNGLESPACKSPLQGEGLSGRTLRNCSTSGFVASAAPTDDYGLDVHIDTGLLDLSKGGVQSAFQDVLIAPIWMALVWVVHALCVMLEWCFTLDLLDSSATGGLGAGLRQMQAALTQPWLVTVLAIASVVVLYNGLVRRRVAETLGEAALMVAMIVGGLWTIADPAGSVGALGRWANQASLGTLAVAARGDPSGGAGSLGESMQSVFAAAIEAPWCYLEFGDVGWCRDTGRLDPPLRAAGLKIADAELHAAGCAGPAAHSSCNGDASQAQALQLSARLLREAQSNGAIFLALAPNGPARNSINEEGSLLRTLCGTDEATNCHGATAAQAEFRTGSGTMQRVAGLVFIVIGATGMILLLGFVALRLLGAAVFSLLFLLLAPGMVLAPALGDAGRTVFRRWLAQLLGAVVSKLLFSFLLGVLLAVLAILGNLQALGWWTQWLLMSAFWWGAFLRRHHALALAEGSFRGTKGAPVKPRPTLTRRVGALFETRSGWAVARWAHGRRANALPPEHADGGAQPAAMRPTSLRAPGRVNGALVAAARPDTGSGPHARAGAEETRDERPEDQRRRDRDDGAPADSDAAGGPRADQEGGEGAGAGASSPPQTAARPTPVPVRTPSPRADEPGVRAGAGPPGGEPPPSHLDVPDTVRRREARLEIDREIERQREAAEAAAAAAPQGPDRPQPPTPARADAAPRAGTSDDQPGDAGSRESSVMRDAREVEAGRKRQLGHGRP